MTPKKYEHLVPEAASTHAGEVHLTADPRC